MSTTSLLLILIVAALVGVAATLVMLRRQRHEREAETGETLYAASSEGQKRCPSCGMFNLWTDRTCISCGKKLAG
jgi:hypothetical protein